MNEPRIELFDLLGDEIQKIHSVPAGPEIGKIAIKALKILADIVVNLETSEKYEHGLQRVPDLRQNLQQARDDFRLSELRLEELVSNYRMLRMNSHAGKHKEIG